MGRTVEAQSWLMNDGGIQVSMDSANSVQVILSCMKVEASVTAEALGLKWS